jgi:nucleoid DNA-binding protein
LLCLNAYPPDQFRIRYIAEKGRNSQTVKKITISARKVPVFKAGAALKKALK